MVSIKGEVQEYVRETGTRTRNWHTHSKLAHAQETGTRTVNRHTHKKLAHAQ
jgi:hypothetical protein